MLGLWLTRYQVNGVESLRIVDGSTFEDGSWNKPTSHHYDARQVIIIFLIFQLGFYSFLT
jgi:hypothetical protein